MNIVAESRIELNNVCNTVDLYNIRHKRKLHEKNESKLRYGMPIKLTPNCNNADKTKVMCVNFVLLL